MPVLGAVDTAVRVERDADTEHHVHTRLAGPGPRPTAGARGPAADTERLTVELAGPEGGRVNPVVGRLPRAVAVVVPVMGRGKAKKPRGKAPRDLGPVSAGHVEAVSGVMTTLTGLNAAEATAAHELVAGGPDALADYHRVGRQWRVTVMGLGAPETDHMRVTDIPSMSEALRVALAMADGMFPPGTALLHTVDRIAEAWMPTYLAEHGSLPRQNGWTAVAGGDGTDEPGRSYVAAFTVSRPAARN